MGTTAKGLIYPDSDDNTNLWEHFQALAESTDDAIGADTAEGLVSAWTTMSLTPGAGFTVTAARYRVLLGVLVVFDATFTRTGADIVADSKGNITDTTVASAVPSAIRPAAARYLRFNRGGAASGALSVGADGVVTAVTLEGNAVLESTIIVHDTYVLG